MRRTGLVAASALLLAACGGGEKSAFDGTWGGTKSIGPVGDTSGIVTALVPDLVLVIRDDRHGALELNGFAPARVTSPDTFEALPVSFPTVYGPGHHGPGQGTTTVTGGSGHLTGLDTLTISLTFSEVDAGVEATSQATYRLERRTGAGMSPAL